MSLHDEEPQSSEPEPRDQARSETGLSKDPSQNTSPPSNPPIEQDALDAGREKLERIVNW